MRDNHKPFENGSNGNGHQNGGPDEDLKRLRIVLQRAVLKEEAPESLRQRIRKLIREN